MNLTVHIPDDLASRLSAAGGDLSRRALEALAAESTSTTVSPRPNCSGSSELRPASNSMSS